MYIRNFFGKVDVYRVVLMFLLCFALFFRFEFIFIERLWSDEAFYSWLGRRIFENPFLMFSEEVSSFHPPLFSIFLALAHFFLPSELACHFVVFVFYGWGIVAIYVLGSKIGNKFVGLFCAVVLAFNGAYFGSSTLVILDGPLMVFCIMLAIRLVDIKPESPLRDHIGIGLWTVGILLLKSSGIMVLGWLFFYYILAFPEVKVFERIKKLFIPCSIVATFFIFLSIKNYLQLGSIHPHMPVINFIHYRHLPESFKDFFTLINLPLLMALFSIGIFVIWKAIEKKKLILLSAWAIIAMASIMALGIDIEFRFSLLILPPLLIVCGIGLEKIIEVVCLKLGVFKNFIKGFIFCCVLFFLLIDFYLSLPNLRQTNQYFTGYYRAGEKIRELAGSQSLILAGSGRQIRYTTGINFKEYGGRIIGFTHDKAGFEKFIEKEKGHIILEIDFWERQLQPQWAVPMTTSSLEYLRDKGFSLTYIVRSKSLRSKNKNPLPIIYIFERFPKIS